MILAMSNQHKLANKWKRRFERNHKWSERGNLEGERTREVARRKKNWWARPRDLQQQGLNCSHRQLGFSKKCQAKWIYPVVDAGAGAPWWVGFVCKKLSSC